MAKVVRHLEDKTVEVRMGKNFRQRATFRPEQFDSLADQPKPNHTGITIALGIETPGFRLASARTFQVWLALVSHAQEFGRGILTGQVNDHAQESVHGIVVAGDSRGVPARIGCDAVVGEWTVDLLARACGVNRNTASPDYS